jgi:hypothetical protein
MKKFQYIFCGGMIRSGSTLQYNIASEIIERKGLGKREIWIDDHNNYFSNSRVDGLTTFKSHVLSSPIANCLRDGLGLAIASYRDVRDVVASWQIKHRKIFALEECIEVGRTAIRNFSQWEDLPEECVYIGKYEDFFCNISGEIKKISEVMQVEINSTEIADIAATLNAVEIAKKLNSLSEDALTTSGIYKWDTKTLIHLDHLNGGAVGRYRTEISEEILKAMNLEFADWLEKHCYQIERV